MDPVVEQAFRSRAPLIVDVDDCIEWQRTRSTRGYGVFMVNYRQFRAHRVSLELAIGRALRPDEDACHRCDNPPCVNPRHLFAGSRADNQRDKAEKGRSAKGERNGGGGKLSADDVREIRRCHAAGDGPVAIGRRFGISHTEVRYITSGKHWSHVT